MVYRVFVEKKEGLANEAMGLLNEAKHLLGMDNLQALRLFNRYDAEKISRELFDAPSAPFSLSPSWITSMTASSCPVLMCLPWRLCPVSLICGPTPPPSASRSFPRGSAP